MINDKAVREGMIQGQGAAGASRDRLSNILAPTAGKKEEKQKDKEEKAEGKAEKKEMKFKSKMTKKEAEECGFMKAAKACGWGVYDASALDGGEGGVWYLEKDAVSGEEFLCKQTDAAGDVVRRVKASAKA